MLDFKRKCAALLCLLSCCAAPWGSVARGETTGIRIGVKDITGKAYSLPQAGQKATVLVFFAHDCPISNSYAPEISRIAGDYSKRGVRTLVVYAEEDFDLAGARKHAKEYGFTMPVVWDSKLRLSHTLGATVTPEVVVLSPGGKKLYQGRIDNRFLSYGKKRAEPSQRDLRGALDAIVKGQPAPHAKTTAVGCFIPE